MNIEARPVVSPNNVTICVATYRRVDMLDTLLSGVVPQATALGATVVVVDNDPEASARGVCARYSEVKYYVEPTPGIAAARNACLFYSPADTEAYVFVDDDEYVADNWLTVLVRTLNETEADAVVGPAHPIYPAHAPRWMKKGQFFEYSIHETGPHPYLPATNNTILRTGSLLKLDRPHFDDAFGLTGGSDTELFHRLSLAGCQFYWTNDAIVYEPVLDSRLSFAWIWRRGVRSGNVLARIRLRHQPPWRVFLGGIVRLNYGLLVTLRSLLLGRGLQYRDTIYIMRAFGFWGAVAGRNIVEYRRGPR